MIGHRSAFHSYDAEEPVKVPLIFSRMLELRRKIGGLKASKGTGAPFPVRSSKELMLKLRTALDELNLLAPVVHQEVRILEMEKGTGCHVTATVRVIAEDGSYLDLVGSGHGLDKDDKAGGKASTYAWKDAILKGCSIPEKEMLDTDQEAGHGAEMRPRPPGKKAQNPAAEGAQQDLAEDLRAALEACTSREEAQALRPRLKQLPKDQQARLDPLYKEKTQ